MSRDDEQAWADLVDAFHASPDDQDPRWPVDEGNRPAADAAMAPLAPDLPERRAPADPDDHFVPPPPPPLPRGDGVSRLAWAAVLGVPVFLVVAVAFGWTLPSWLTGLAVFAMVGGFVTLIARLRGHDPYDPDDGAVV